jgi:hypothetical protein
VNGGAGNDTLDGDAGIDKVMGGAGSDLLIFDAAENQYILNGKVYDANTFLEGATGFTGYDVYDGGTGAVTKVGGVLVSEVDTLKIHLSAGQYYDTDFMTRLQADLDGWAA